jgi:hypothetical protein
MQFKLRELDKQIAATPHKTGELENRKRQVVKRFYAWIDSNNFAIIRHIAGKSYDEKFTELMFARERAEDTGDYEEVRSIKREIYEDFARDFGQVEGAFAGDSSREDQDLWLTWLPRPEHVASMPKVRR